MGTGINRALEQSSQNLIQLILAAGQRELEERRLDLEQERLTGQQRSAQVQDFLSLLRFQQPGQAAHPLLISEGRKIFPDVSETDLQSFVDQPDTIESLRMEAIGRARGRLTPDEAADLDRDLLEREFAGQRMIPGQRQIERGQATIQLGRLDEIRKNPRLIEQYGNQLLQFEPLQPLQIPGFGSVNVTNADFARIATSIHQSQASLAQQERLFNEGQLADVRNTVTSLLKEKNIAVPQNQILRIQRAVHDREDPAAAVAALRGGVPWGQEITTYTGGWTPQLEAALQMYMGGTALADNYLDSLLGSSPDVANWVNLAGVLSERVEKKDVLPLLDDLADVLSERGVPIGQRRTPLGNFGSSFRLRPSTAPQTPQMPQDATAPGAPAPSAQTPGAANQVPPRQRAEQDAQELASGRINLAEVRRRWPGDAEVVNGIARRSTEIRQAQRGQRNR